MRQMQLAWIILYLDDSVTPFEEESQDVDDYDSGTSWRGSSIIQTRRVAAKTTKNCKTILQGMMRL